MTPSESSLHGRTHAVAIELTDLRASRPAGEDGSKAVKGRALCCAAKTAPWIGCAVVG